MKFLETYLKNIDTQWQNVAVLQSDNVNGIGTTNINHELVMWSCLKITDLEIDDAETTIPNINGFFT